MKSLANALVYIVTFINSYPEDEGNLESSLASKVTGNIAWELRGATEQEKDALSKAAQESLAEELSAAYPRAEWVDCYRNWMGYMFGEDNWQENKRIDHGTSQEKSE